MPISVAVDLATYEALYEVALQQMAAAVKSFRRRAPFTKGFIRALVSIPNFIERVRGEALQESGGNGPSDRQLCAHSVFPERCFAQISEALDAQWTGSTIGFERQTHSPDADTKFPLQK
jgi:hypothetical protein